MSWSDIYQQIYEPHLDQSTDGYLLHIRTYTAICRQTTPHLDMTEHLYIDNIIVGNEVKSWSLVSAPK